VPLVAAQLGISARRSMCLQQIPSDLDVVPNARLANVCLGARFRGGQLTKPIVLCATTNGR
jgi:hypothetical protein